MEKLLTTFRKSNIFLSITAALLAWQTIFVCELNTQRLYFIMAFLFFATQFAYSATDINFHLSKSSDSKAIKFQISSPSYFHTVSAIISLLICMILFFHLSPYAQSVCVIIGAAAFVYNFPMTINKQFINGTRTVYILKNLWLVLVWAAATVILPLADLAPPADITRFSLVFIKRFLFIYAITLPFDIRDLESDQKDNVKTLPLSIGIVNTKLLALLALALFCISVYLEHLYANPVESIINKLSVPLYLSALVAAILIIFSQPYRSKLYYAFLMDGTMMIQFLLIYFWAR